MTTDSWIGQTLASQFTITRRLGQGGMGAVYLADQIEIDRQVVVKILHPERNEDPEALARFRQEARAIARLNHPNIVQVHVFGETDQGAWFLAMEYVPGPTLSQLRREQHRLPQGRVLRIADQVCAALAEAHGAGVVHRDIKPPNILVIEGRGGPDRVKVLDFGIAKLVGTPGVTAADMTTGTPRYMAPEQIRGGALDGRTNLYALGLVLYELLTGQHPFPVEDPFGQLRAHLDTPPAAPSILNPDLQLLPRVEALLLRCIAKEPAERFQSATALQREVRRALRDLPESEREYPTPGGPSDWEAIAPEGLPGGLTGDSPGGDTTDGYVADGGSQPEILVEAQVLVEPESAEPGGPAGQDGSPASADLLPEQGGQSDQTTGESGPLRSSHIAMLLIASAVLIAVIAGVFLLLTKPGGGGSAGTGGSQMFDYGPPPPAGVELAGLPAPAGARLMSDSPQALSFHWSGEPRAALAFYAAEFVDWRPKSATAGALVFDGVNAPVTSVSVTRTGDGVMVALMRNPLLPGAPAAGIDEIGPFGELIYPGSRVTLRTPTDVIYSSRAPLPTVIDYYAGAYEGAKGVQLMRTPLPSGEMLLLNFPEGDQLFSHLQVMADPIGAEGGVRIAVTTSP